MARYASDIAFTDTVKAEQAARGSRAQYARMEQAKGWPTTVTPDLAAFIAQVRSFYLGTANKDGQPYIQHRGGSAGFLHVLDERTLGFADLAGNRQYITAGNLADNPRAFIFLMDYANRRRVKIWGRARIVENDDELLSRLRPPVGNATAERAILFEIEAWDRNCPQHIPQLVAIEDVQDAVRTLQDRILLLEAELEQMRAAQ
ncbi:MAG: pyridoxamine 5'-phosphate oxidase family protein [Hyphomicrobium sp.]|jgi:predicted pyridoxine 5'-phosphate oxidase superfamily flavin-nucleotide-binding protein|uniref:pyridoxamine 5'-phosphate oxidase family protein n=1 Tax=Hyphomicrobium sp. TaxID=82 RepID=UPI0025C2A228|nr:pyridoxamine 5'-phosphate oxidase family protein [Hyphomicrobium sp.]MBX9861836.1 pyridoxamine 5'-phosphate oxidase family protein [Hyphomicrobium sp.]